MYGKRGRVGLLVPSTNFVAEIEIARMMPEEVTVHTSRCMLEDAADQAGKVDALLAMSRNVLRAAREVACVKPKVIAWACTSGSFLQGAEQEGDMEKEIQSATGIPAVTTSTAMIEAMRALGIRKLALVTPYIDEINRNQVRFIETLMKEVKIVSLYGLGMLSSFAKNELEPESAYDAALKGDAQDADGVFISCTAWRTIEVIGALEKRLNKPVLSSNQATGWAILTRMGLRGDILWGSLFQAGG
jgi:maleate isomerase